MHAQVLRVIPCEPHAMQSLPICFPSQPPLIDRHHPMPASERTRSSRNRCQAMQYCCRCNPQLRKLRLLKRCHPQTCFSEFPIFVHRLDCPIKLLPQRLGEELFDGHVKFLGEDHSKTRIDVILRASVSATRNINLRKHSQS